jgi:glycyl-tRNA synthetase
MSAAKADTRATLADLEVGRFFFAPSFEIYGGVAGLYDLGPVGCEIERNLLARWRDHFMIEEDMCEVRCSMLTPYRVLEASGHTAKFADYMVTDTVNFRLFRADHLIEQFLEQRIPDCQDPAASAEMTQDLAAVGDASCDDVERMIQSHKILSPDGNPLSKPVPFNLMFNTYIGPGESAMRGFLRPETAQGIFVNFPRLWEFQRRQLPFACAQIGSSFRNEIAPRNGLIRCREFMMAEIEHFADPDALNDFPKFEGVAGIEVVLFPADVQEADGKPLNLTLAEAVGRRIICHKTLGYFIGRTYLFLLALGCDPARIRFRQHRAHEKAHYARDCWDAEMLCSVGWIECVGLADRQSFDLSQHIKASGSTQLTVPVQLDEPIEEERLTLLPNQAYLGPKFKGAAKSIKDAMAALQPAEIDPILGNVNAAVELAGTRPADEAAVQALPDDVRARFLELTTIKILGNDIPFWGYTVSKAKVKVSTRTIVPCVIEPSFGIGRIMTVLLEHTYYLRPDGARRVLKLPAFLAPYKCVVLPLGVKIVPIEYVNVARRALKTAVISHSVDSSGVSIGKRYARSDELGIPFAITLDPVTRENGTVTLRERDSTAQIRLPLQDAVAAIAAMSAGTDSWESIAPRYETVLPPADDK